MSNTQIINQTSFFHSKDKTRKLFLQKFSSPASEITKILIVTHGLGEHSDAYRSFCEKICSQNPHICVLAWDFYGHGMSDGLRGYVGDILWYIDDLVTLIENTQKEFPNSKPYLFAHSLGGLIQLSAIKQQASSMTGIKGFIFSNPCVALNFIPPKWKTVGAEVLVNFLPKTILSSGLKNTDLSSDKSYLKEFEQDPLRHKKISPRLFLGMNKLMSELTPLHTDTPTLALLSPKDPICKSSAAKKIFTEPAKVILFNNSLHEILNDVEKEKATEHIMEFLNEDN